MTNLGRLSVCAAVAVLFAAAPAAAAIGVNVDVLWRPNPNDDMQVGLHLSNMAYPQPRESVIDFFHEIQNPYEDYPVIAFIAYHAHVSPAVVWDYKKKGHKWSAVMLHFGVRPSVLFVDLPAPPGPPYGNAYGHWRKQGNRMTADMFGNDDVRYWVGLHTLAVYSNVTPVRAYEWQHGKRYASVAGARFREKQGKGPKMQEAGFDGPGKGRGKARGHDKDKD